MPKANICLQTIFLKHNPKRIILFKAMSKERKSIMKEKLIHTPDGIRDIYGDEMEIKSKVLDSIHHVFHGYGFHDIETPTFEYFNIFNQSIGSAPSNLMYKFFDRNNNTLVLRPDFTPSVARCVTKYYENEELPIKLCYTGKVFKNVPLHQGKSNETTQIGCEFINDDSSAGDAEMLALTIDSLKAAGLTDFKIEIGEVEYFKGLIEDAGIDKDEEDRIRSYIEMRNFFGLSEYVLTLDIPDNIRDAFSNFAKLFGGKEILDNASGFTSNKKSLDALERLKRVYTALSYYGYEDYVGFDLGMLNGYEYYTGIIFRAYTYGTGDAIVKGGRYNTLLSEFGKNAPSIGFTILVDELLLALSAQHLKPAASTDGILVLYNIESQKEAVSFATKLRSLGKKVSLIRKSARHELEEYVDYSVCFGISYIYYLIDENSSKLIHNGETKDLKTGELFEGGNV